MEKRVEKIKHTKTVLDGQFTALFEELPSLSDKDVLDYLFPMANIIFALAEEFGYREFLEEEIYKYNSERL